MSRVSKKRLFFNPSSSTKDTFMKDELIHNKTIARVKRRRITRKFYNPSCSVKSIFLDEILSENSRQFIVPKHVEKNIGDVYKKDNMRKECSIKKQINQFVASHVKSGDKCIVLDAKKVRTTKHILKAVPDVKKIVIPNNSQAFYDIERFAKNKDNVFTKHVSLFEHVSKSTEKYDVIYMDTCGQFTTGKDNDLKSTIDICLKKKMLNKNGLLGITITKRSSIGLKNVDWDCFEFVIDHHEHMDYQTCFSYGSMVTLFFKYLPL